VAAQRTDLSISQVGVTGFGISAVAQAHELDAEVNPGGCTDVCHAVAEIVLFPRQMGLAPTVKPIARNDQRAVSINQSITMPTLTRRI
jgi:hypothetical protein